MAQFNRHPLISVVTEAEKGDEDFGSDIDLDNVEDIVDVVEE